MKKECELQKSKEDEDDGKKGKEKTSQDLIEEVLKESQDDEAVDEEKEKTLEDLIEEILEEELSVDVDVKRRGPFLWISRGSYIHTSA